MYRACVGVTVVAALFRPGEINRFTEAIEQRRPRVNAKLAVLPVDAKDDRDRSLDVRFRSASRAEVVPLDRDVSVQKRSARRLLRVRLGIVWHRNLPLRRTSLGILTVHLCSVKYGNNAVLSAPSCPSVTSHSPGA